MFRQGSSARAEIDPTAWRGRPTTTGLLRASGDRPAVVESVPVRNAAPPRERRSTRGRRERVQRRAGSSARAEIDPEASRSRRGPVGLLRASGDRPSRNLGLIAPPTAPPRERRSTLGVLHQHQRAAGSSARAEIDPARCARPLGRCGLLRASGDRPLSRSSAPTEARAPPRERRSTLVATRDAQRARGSSARAEIDPAGDPVPCVGVGLLRASGDRPQCGGGWSM